MIFNRFYKCNFFCPFNQCLTCGGKSPMEDKSPAHPRLNPPLEGEGKQSSQVPSSGSPYRSECRARASKNGYTLPPHAGQHGRPCPARGMASQACSTGKSQKTDHVPHGSTGRPQTPDGLCPFEAMRQETYAAWREWRRRGFQFPSAESCASLATEQTKIARFRYKHPHIHRLLKGMSTLWLLTRIRLTRLETAWETSFDSILDKVNLKQLMGRRNV